MLRVRFLGTGPAGGRAGRGRSRRTESSVLVHADDSAVLIDATRDFAAQRHWIDRVDLVLLTHAHRDASGGVRRLDQWLCTPVPLFASRATVRALRSRYRTLAHLELRGVSSRSRIDWRSLSIEPLVVPHARDVTTFAWRITHGGTSLVYASDVAQLTAELGELCVGCDLLVLDGAMWRRQIFTHLEIRSTVPVVARWRVQRILLTQLGRSTPEHDALARWLRGVDPRIGAAYDGLEVTLGPHGVHRRRQIATSRGSR